MTLTIFWSSSLLRIIFLLFVDLKFFFPFIFVVCFQFCRFGDWQLFFFFLLNFSGSLMLLVHCCLASITSNEKLAVVYCFCLTCNVLYSLVAFKNFTLSLVNNCNCMTVVPKCVCSLWNMEIFCNYLLKNFLCPALVLLSFWDSNHMNVRILYCLTHRSLRLCLIHKYIFSPSGLLVGKSGCLAVAESVEFSQPSISCLLLDSLISLKNAVKRQTRIWMEFTCKF